MQPDLPTNPSQQSNIEPFRWLFIAHYADGHTIYQTPDDVLPDHAEFRDAVNYPSEMVSFELANVDGKQIVTVDLTTGAFIVNSTPLHAHDQFFEPSMHKLNLVYFREKREIATASMSTDAEGQAHIGNIVPTRSYVNRYFIGWQTTVNGKNKQVTLAVG